MALSASYDCSASMSDVEGLTEAMSKTLLQERRARRLAEEDAQRLYNRIRQLQKEEERASRRIEQTQTKVTQIRAHHARNEERVASKEARQRQLEQEVERQRREIAKLKQDHQRTRQKSEARVLAEKASCAATTKEQRVEIEKSIEELRQEQIRAAQDKKEAVKRSQAEGEQKVHQHRKERLLMAQGGYERRVQEEMDAKQQKEAEIAQLARLELELIERLKKKQAEQQRAYQQLEAALALSSTVRASYTQSSKRRSQQSTRPSTGASGTQGGTSDPSDEDVACAFAAYDVAATGSIPVTKVEGLMLDLGMPLSPEQFEQALLQLDPGGTGSVSFGTFLLWWKG